ncbi:hypothetical protein NLJ89_g5922 [Agrocybe chaxingu]|uniref:Uncharacterized protein n=1 Tax=Agrocybe chaxingu TaxID=84603 RepID=A0A9W8K0B8_9AGAR|nr:hypothetical protein NLJ89_g5922 [Agrocybe chaxingu]
MGRAKRTNKPYYRARHKTLSDLPEEDTKHNFEERFKGGGSRRQASEPVYFGVLDGRAESFKTVTQENYRNIAKDLKEDPHPQQCGARKHLSSSSRVSELRAPRRRDDARRATMPTRTRNSSQIYDVPQVQRHHFSPSSSSAPSSLYVGMQEHGHMHSFSQIQPSVDGIGLFRERIPESYEQPYQVHQDYTQLSVTPIPVGQNADWGQWQDSVGQLQIPSMCGYLAEPDPELNAHTFGISQDSFAPFPINQSAIYIPSFTYLSSNHSIASSPMSLVESPASQLFPLPLHEPDNSPQTVSFDYANSIWAGVAPATDYGY